MDTPFNEGAAGTKAGGPKADGFLGRNCHQNSVTDIEKQDKLPLLDSRDPGAMLALRTLFCPPRGRPFFLTKQVVRRGACREIIKSEKPKHFSAVSFDVSNFPKLLNLLLWLSDKPDWGIVSGARLPTANPKCMRRIIEDDEETGEIATIADAPRWWLAMDIDDLPLPDLVRDLRGKCLLVRSWLPPEFQNARCIGWATSSHGIDPGSRLRFFFMLDRPLTCAEKRIWLKPLAKIGDIKFVDPGIYTANQLIYTASPIFTNPEMDDPFHGGEPRWVIIDGDDVIVTPSADQLKQSEPRDYPTRMALDGACGESHGLIRSSMAMIHATSPGGRHDQILIEAYKLAGLVVGRALDGDAALRGLIRAGTEIIPGERVITPDEIIREWKHALRKKQAEEDAEQRHDLSYYDGGD